MGTCNVQCGTGDIFKYILFFFVFVFVFGFGFVFVLFLFLFLLCFAFIIFVLFESSSHLCLSTGVCLVVTGIICLSLCLVIHFERESFVNYEVKSAILVDR